MPKPAHDAAHHSTVVIRPGEHPFVVHATVAHYADARLSAASSIEAAIASGFFRTHQDCSTELLGRLLAGALASPYTPGKVKRYLRQI